MKLYELVWGLYPRRVAIYLAEKGLAEIERIAFDATQGWPPAELKSVSPSGTVPILIPDDGPAIRQSVAILEYLEEIHPSPSMLGRTAQDRARTRELMSVIDEACIHFGTWCHKASPVFAMREPQSHDAARVARDDFFHHLTILEALVSETSGPFLAGGEVTVADCMAMATFQFADRFYGVPLPEDCPALGRWYKDFSQRASATPPEYPKVLHDMAYGLPSIQLSKAA